QFGQFSPGNSLHSPPDPGSSTGTRFAANLAVNMPMIQPSKMTFESIESAHAYVGLLREAVDETTQMIEQEMTTPREFAGSRHLDALRLVHYKLHSLREHLIVSGRLLSDLRSLRRYLLDERASERGRGAEATSVAASHPDPV